MPFWNTKHDTKVYDIHFRNYVVHKWDIMIHTFITIMQNTTLNHHDDINVLPYQRHRYLCCSTFWEKVFMQVAEDIGYNELIMASLTRYLI